MENIIPKIVVLIIIFCFYLSYKLGEYSVKKVIELDKGEETKMNGKKYTWNICFNMKSGDKVEDIYLTDKNSSGDVSNEIVEAMNKNGVVWLHMETKNKNEAVSVNLSEVESMRICF